MSLDEQVKKTADLMSRIIKKPPLTAKLLSKPPFRYLHDLISELMRVTMFAQGLYTESEQVSDNVKDKEAKIAYLNKIINVVGLATGVKVKANPSKIVAGKSFLKINTQALNQKKQMHSSSFSQKLF